ncbi:MAG: glycosyltransferase family 2 protein [Candidatus Dormibacteria bacterium]
MPARAETTEASIIVPAYRAGGRLRACVDSLLAMRFAGTFEVIVAASADTPELLPQLPPDPRLTIIPHVPRLRAASARNRAARVARGRALAFTDADVVVHPDWLSRLVEASDGNRLCVAGSVVNGTPESPAGTTEYLIGFLDLHPRRPPATAWHGATCNLLIPRHLWDHLGPFPEDLDGGEDTLVTVHLRERGLFRFAPSAGVVHHNRTALSRVLANQFYAGGYTARLGRRSPYKLRPLVRYTALAPLAVGARMISLYARAAAWDRSLLRRAVGLSPVVMLALLTWGAGLTTEGLRMDLGRTRGRTPTG